MKASINIIFVIAIFATVGLFASCGTSANDPYQFTDEVVPVSITFPSYPHHSQSEHEPIYRRMLQCHRDSVGYWLKLEQTNFTYSDTEIQQAKTNFQTVVQQQGFTISSLIDSTYMELPAIYAHSIKNEQEVYMLMCFKDNIRVEASAMLTDKGESKPLIDAYFQTLKIE